MTNTRIACIGASLAALIAVFAGRNAFAMPEASILIIAIIGAALAVALFGK